MLAISVVFIILTLAVSITAGVTLRGKNGCAVRSCASGIQLTLFMTAVLYIMQMAQASVIYDNQKLNDQYIKGGIDLYFLGKTTALLLGVAAVIVIVTVITRLLDSHINAKPAKIIIPALILIAAAVSLICLANSAVYGQYLDMLIPAIIAGAAGVMIFTGNAFCTPEKRMGRIILITFNAVNALLAIAAAVIVTILAKGVLEGMQTNNVGAILLTLLLVVMVAPSLVSTVSAVRNSLKQRRTK